MNPLIEYGVLFLVFVLLVVGFFLLFKSMVLKDKIRDNMDKLYSRLAEKDEEKVKELETQRRRYGNVTAKKRFFDKIFEKLNNLLIYSGWGVRFPWLNTSTYIVISVVSCSLVFLVIEVISFNIVLAVLAAFTLFVIPIFVMSGICDAKYRAVERQLSFCVNMVANMSAGTNDLVTVFDEVAPFMGEPLRSSIERAVSVANLNGSAVELANRLCKEIEHPLFVRFIRNLEVCSRADANYKSIAKDFAPQVERYVRAAERKRSIFANGRGQIFALVGLGIVLICTAGNTMGDSILHIVADMLQNPLGMVVLIVEGIIFIGSSLYGLLGMRR